MPRYVEERWPGQCPVDTAPFLSFTGVGDQQRGEAGYSSVFSVLLTAEEAVCFGSSCQD